MGHYFRYSVLVVPLFCANFGHQLLQSFIWLCTYQALAIADKSRHTCYTIAARFFPVGVNSGFEAALCQHRAGFLFIKPGRFYNIDDDFDIADMAAIDKIGFEKFSWIAEPLGCVSAQDPISRARRLL